MRGKILIVEDEQKIARVLELELKHEQFEAVCASNGPDGLKLAQSGEWDLILLDIMLPGMDGLEVLRGIRETDPDVPIIMLTARDSVTDKVDGLDLGANDYVTKPFAIEELMARIRSAIRTSARAKKASAETDEADCYRVDDLEVNISSRTAVRNGKQIDLTPREFDLLLYLLRNYGSVKSREEILSDVWGYDFAGNTNLVDVYIRYLRQKIDEGAPRKLIATKRGIGYYIKDPAEGTGGSPAP